MIAAAVAQKTAWSWDKFTFNWFDAAVIVILAFGLWRGRKHGMSREFLPVSQWVVIVAAGALGYAWLGGCLMQSPMVRSLFGKNFTDRTEVFISSYLIIAGLVWLIFVPLRRHYGPKLVGSPFFGSGEYYLGMISGLIRYACVLIAVLAVLNAPIYTAADIQARKAYNNHVYGGGLKGFDGDFIPSRDEVQAVALKQSLMGPFIKDKFSMLLINSAVPVAVKKAAPAKP